MNLNEIPIPLSDNEANWFVGDEFHDDHDYVPVTFARNLERRLTIARTALEAITHDMHASQMIHDLCEQTLKLTAPPEQ